MEQNRHTKPNAAWSVLKKIYRAAAPRAYSLLMFGALLAVLSAKFYHCLRSDLLRLYLRCILADIAFLLTVEIILVLICFAFASRRIVRIVTVIAAICCTWSVMNAGWIIRTGTQILPVVLLPFIRDPLNALSFVGGNIVKMPIASVFLFGPSAIALAFFVSVLARPQLPDHNKHRLTIRVFVTLGIILISLIGIGISNTYDTSDGTGLSFNAHIKAFETLFRGRENGISETVFENPARVIPAFDQIDPPQQHTRKPYHVVIIVLEGVQYQYTSLADPNNLDTPFLAKLAKEGICFPRTYCNLTHTTKMLFSLHTGCFPSVSPDIAEAVPARKPYASLATILKSAGYRTAFFQSAKGNFEARPALVHNLGFDTFVSRDHLDDPNHFVGYLGCDEFAMLDRVRRWISKDQKPFLLTYLCSVTHDPYVVPEWFEAPAKEQADRYRQAIRYTDSFIAEFNRMLETSDFTDNTVFIVIGDHGEAFGEHGSWGHERNVFNEAIRIPFYLRVPDRIQTPAKDIAAASIDLTPTVLGLLGFDLDANHFDGIDLFAQRHNERKIYFSGWFLQSPAGVLIQNRKYIFNPISEMVTQFNLQTDPNEQRPISFNTPQIPNYAQEIMDWRKNSIFQIDQAPSGEILLYKKWLCRWENRICWAKFIKENP